MTDISERAAQLAQRIAICCMEAADTFNYTRCTDMLISFAKSLGAESVNLARGVAIEQAAQAVTSHLRSNESERDGILIQAASWIRSLDPDAAQALAAHDAIERLHTMKMAGNDCDCEPCNMFREWLNEHDAEIERRARLDEHKKCCSQCNTFGIASCKMFAVFAESQPAPAGESQPQAQEENAK